MSEAGRRGRCVGGGCHSVSGWGLRDGVLWLGARTPNRGGFRSSGAAAGGLPSLGDIRRAGRLQGSGPSMRGVGIWITAGVAVRRGCDGGPVPHDLAGESGRHRNPPTHQHDILGRRARKGGASCHQRLLLLGEEWAQRFRAAPTDDALAHPDGDRYDEVTSVWVAKEILHGACTADQVVPPQRVAMILALSLSSVIARVLVGVLCQKVSLLPLVS